MLEGGRKTQRWNYSHTQWCEEFATPQLPLEILQPRQGEMGQRGFLEGGRARGGSVCRLGSFTLPLFYLYMLREVGPYSGNSLFSAVKENTLAGTHARCAGSIPIFQLTRHLKFM